MNAIQPNDMSLQLAKKSLRKQIKQTLSTISSDQIISQTNTCIKTLLTLPEYKTARAISTYLSMPSGEISTESIVQDAFGAGKAVFIPFTYKLNQPMDYWPPSIMDMLEIQSFSEYQTLKRDKWGIPSLDEESVDKRRNCFGGHGKSEGEADREAHEDELEMIIMPGLAFDTHLDRLGHGKGYYDFFLQRYLWHTQKAKRRMPFLVGLALEEQLLSPEKSVPKDITDYRLDALILGSGELLRADNTNSTSPEEQDTKS